MEAVLLIGIQATGKSTFYRDRFFATHVRINLDMLRTRNRERLLVEACLAGGQAFVVDNTNPTADERARYIAAAKRAQFRVAGYYFESKATDALRRNAERPPQQQVPRVGVLGTLRRLEVPSLDEGFDLLSYVQLGERGSFTIKEWQP